jgi:hypothetical protein
MARKAAKKKEAENKEAVVALKSLKSNVEVESFYRFIHENNLRREAHQLMGLALKSAKKSRKRTAKKLQ